MKKNITFYTIGSLLLIPFLSNAQSISFRSTNEPVKLKNPQTVIGKVFYDFSYVPDTTHRDSLTYEIFELSFAKNASMFTSFSTKNRDSAMKKMVEEQVNEQMKNAAVSAGGKQDFKLNIDASKLNMASNASFSRDKFFTDAANEGTSLHITNLVRTAFLIKDTAEKISWKILDSTKTIQGNLCQKAIGESHGRTYTAWFCADIPYSFGPRRLNGLPGLILEAYDEKHEVNYVLNRIENIKNTGEMIGLPEDGVDASPKDFAKAQEAFNKNPQAFVQSQMPPTQGATQGMGMTIITAKASFQGTAIPGAKSRVNNNPIDLK
jgi:GLPGLI family protein